MLEKLAFLCKNKMFLQRNCLCRTNHQVRQATRTKIFKINEANSIKHNFNNLNLKTEHLNSKRGTRSLKMTATLKTTIDPFMTQDTPTTIRLKLRPPKIQSYEAIQQQRAVISSIVPTKQVLFISEQRRSNSTIYSDSEILKTLQRNLYQRRHCSTASKGVKPLSRTLTDPVPPPSKNVQAPIEHTITTKPHDKFQDDSIEADGNEITSSRIRWTTSAKNMLHNYFQTVATDLNNHEYRIQPAYHAVKERKNMCSWNCTYHLKWPEPMKFSAVAQTKKDASQKAALMALNWLQKTERITKDGSPIIYDKNEVRQITNTRVRTLTVEGGAIEDIKAIVSLHEEEFVPKLIKNMENHRNTKKEDDEFGALVNLEESNLHHKIKQRFFGVNKYMAREKVNLPISAYKEEFINLLRENSVVIVKGEPGCGKSTRIPQYTLEAWVKECGSSEEQCRIAVTQPRRIAAISLAERVANERNESCGEIISYQVRLMSNFNPRTSRILYCTTGILLRHLQSDPALSSFTHVILDEAHERDVNTDLLMNLLKNTIELNPKLRLIVMSATIDTDMFKEYFADAPVMNIPGFTYPVDSFFLDDLKRVDLSKTQKMCESECPSVVAEDVVRVIDYIDKNKDEGAILCFLPGWEDISKVQKLIRPSANRVVLCLHSRLQDSDQWKIFSHPPPGVRKIILATNIAETSVTIDDVVYVVDSGIHKENRFDNDKGVLIIDNHWISQASMIQRKGRAGRVRPGESFHLYPRSKFETFKQFTDPEILRTSLTKIVLDSKVYSNNMNALEFMSQLPSPPDKMATRRAVRELKDLELLDEEENLTALGKTLANFQLEPKLAKVLVNAVVYKCVTPIVDIVTLFAAETEIFSKSLLDKDAIKRIKSQCCKNSDHLAVMRLLEKWLNILDESGPRAAENFCINTLLVQHKLFTIEKLRKIHFDYLLNGLHESLPIDDAYSDNDELVKAILLSGVGTLLQHRNWDVVKGRYKKSNVFLTNHNQKAIITAESVNFKKTEFPSDVLVYINEVRSNIRRSTLVRESSVISPLAVLLFSNKKLTVSKEADADNNVLLRIKDTKVEYLCNREVAEDIKKCKEALLSAYQYFIFQMTEGGETDPEINKIWDKILSHVNETLLKNSV